MLPHLKQDKADPYDPNGHQCRHTYEDDLTLLGEHIEVPADHGIEDPYSGGYGGSYGSGRMRPLMAPPEAMAPHYSGYEGQQIHHLPTAGAALPSPKVIFNVKFKRTQRSFVLGPRIQRDLKVGTYVKVEADRGEDLGIVIGKVPAEKYNFSGRTTFRSQSMGGLSDMVPGPTGLSPPGATDLKCIIRLATHDEVSLLTMKRDEEERQRQEYEPPSSPQYSSIFTPEGSPDEQHADEVRRAVGSFNAKMLEKYGENDENIPETDGFSPRTPSSPGYSSIFEGGSGSGRQRGGGGGSDSTSSCGGGL